MRSLSRCIALVMVLVGGSRAGAQHPTYFDVGVGASLRVHLNGPAGPSTVEGRLVSWTPNGVALNIDGHRVREFPLTDVDRLQVRHWKPQNILKGAIAGLAIGAASGAVIGAASYQRPNRDFCCSSRGVQSAVVSVVLGILGTPIGAVAGAACCIRRWDTIPLGRELPNDKPRSDSLDDAQHERDRRTRPVTVANEAFVPFAAKQATNEKVLAR